MTDNRRNIKIDPDLFDRLKEDKGPHKSWPQYLRDECLRETEFHEEEIREFIREELSKEREE